MCNTTLKTTAVMPFPGQKFGCSMPVSVLSWAGSRPLIQAPPQTPDRPAWKVPTESTVPPHTLPCPYHLGSNITQLLYVCHLPSICTERLPLRRCHLSSLGPQRPLWYPAQGTICSTVSDSRKGRTDSQTAHACLLIGCLCSSQNFHDNLLQIAHPKNWDSTHLK